MVQYRALCLPRAPSPHREVTTQNTISSVLPTEKKLASMGEGGGEGKGEMGNGKAVTGDKEERET